MLEFYLRSSGFIKKILSQKDSECSLIIFQESLEEGIKWAISKEIDEFSYGHYISETIWLVNIVPELIYTDVKGIELMVTINSKHWLKCISHRIKGWIVRHQELTNAENAKNGYEKHVICNIDKSNTVWFVTSTPVESYITVVSQHCWVIYPCLNALVLSRS